MPAPVPEFRTAGDALKAALEQVADAHRKDKVMNRFLGISDWVWGVAGAIALVCLISEAVQGRFA